MRSKSGGRVSGLPPLTRQLLAFSRQEVSKPTVLDLNTVVENAQKMLRRLIGEDIRIMLELAHAPAPVKVDAGQMDQILMNLCVNASDAMPNGGLLTISTSVIIFDDATAGIIPGARAGRFMCLAVTDTGTGMSNEVLARMFEPFFSTKANRGRAGGPQPRHPRVTRRRL